MSKARYGSLPFKEQIDFFRAKLNISTEAWDDIWGDAHNSAFMVAGAMENDLLNSFRKAVDIAISEGKGIGWFKSEFNEIVKQNGWQHTGNKDWRARIIYNTNLRQSYNAGRWAQLQQFEFWQYQHGDSFNPRIQHKAWHGLTLHKDDPFWQTHFPANGWGCKCKVSGKRKATADKAPDIELVDYIDKKTGEVIKVPKGIDPSFDYAPHATEQLTRQKQKLIDSAVPYQAPERIVPTAFSTVKGVDASGIDNILKTLPESSQEQIKQLGQFLAKRETKVLFLKEGEIRRGVKAKAIADDVQSYLKTDDRHPELNYIHRSPKRVGGFTWATKNHVVVKVKAGNKLTKASSVSLHQAVTDVLQAAIDNTGPRQVFMGWENGQSNYLARHWSFSDKVKALNPDSAVVSTWLHEIGHQVHYWSGLAKKQWPTELFATEYSIANANLGREFFAEHFVAWLVNREQLALFSPELAEWMDQQVALALTNETKAIK